MTNYFYPNININFESVKTICRDTPQAMIFGWRHCLYLGVKRALERATAPPIKKIFCHKLGSINHTSETLEGHVIEKICPRNSNDKSFCKTAIVNLVLENIYRKKQNLPIIPLIFCLDISENPYPTSSESIASKDEKTNELISNSELRRMYKLCTEFQGTKHHNISEVALETIKFVRLEKTESSEYTLVLIKPFWEAADWQSHWTRRMANKTVSPYKKYSWRNEVIRKIVARTLMDAVLTTCRRCMTLKAQIRTQITNYLSSLPLLKRVFSLFKKYSLDGYNKPVE